MTLNEKLAEAKQHYEAMRAKLESVRLEYAAQEKTYGETKANFSALNGKIKDCEAALAESKTKLAMELRASNGERSSAVKKLLSDRRDTEDLLDEIRVIVMEVEKRMGQLRLAISPLATSYQFSYAAAAAAWSKFNAYRVLADLGPQLHEALAATPAMSEVPIGGNHHGAHKLEKFLCKETLSKEIGVLLAEYKGEGVLSHEAWSVDLGSFPVEEILTPGQAKKLGEKIQEEATA